MNTIVINTLPDIVCSIDCQFIYNYYNQNEDIIDDNTIEVVGFNNNNVERYVDINISYKTNIEKNKTFEFINNEILEKFRSLDKSNINPDLLEKIINLKMFNINSINMSSKPDNKISSYITQSNIVFTNYSEYFEQLKNNKKIHLNNSKSKYFIDTNADNLFLDLLKEEVDESKKLNKNLKNYKNNSLPNSNLSSFSRYSGGIPNYYCLIGFLLEKYIVEEDDFSLKSTMFLYNTVLERLQESDVDETTFLNNITIKEKAVQYGKTYKYSLTPVYIFNLPQSNDYFFTDYFYCRDTSINSKKVVCKEYKRPNSTSHVKFKCLDNGYLSISWAKPENYQGDIFGYQVFKRESIEEPFRLLKQIEFFPNQRQFKRNSKIDESEVIFASYHTTDFLDYEFDKNKIQIYSICSIDARGFTSNYSQQYGIMYNRNRLEVDIDLISPAGAPINMPNILIPRKTRFLESDKSIAEEVCFESGVNKISVYLTPDLVNILSESSDTNILGDNYKFNIFSLDKNINYTSNIKIT